MKVINKLMLLSAIILAITACSNDELDNIQSQPNSKEDTYVGVTLTMNSNNKRVARGNFPNDYNYIGQWAGNDAINNIAIYIVDESTVSVGQYAKNDFKIATEQYNNGQNELAIIPKKAIKTTAGKKNIYVLINANDKVKKHLATAKAETFKEAYRGVIKLDNSVADNGEVSTSASKIANLVEDKDLILMTNSKEFEIEVKSGVSKEEALEKNNSNRIQVSVQRAVARVMVTSAKEEFEVKNGDQVIGVVTDIKWVVAQGENSLYVQQKNDFTTPASSFIPNENSFNTTASKQYDYSGLLEKRSNDPKIISGIPVAKLSDYAQLNQDQSNQEEVLNSLDLTKQSVNGYFILPNTHQRGDDQESSAYKKGNTAYVLVRAKFTPKEFADNETYEAGNDFYRGANGLFYTSKENAQNRDKGGVEGQQVSRYVKGKVLYYAWVNPDKNPGWLNSPVVRNNIYHVQIKNFNTIGTNWNPLVPEDQENPDPKPEDPKNPGNPDPDEPKNPIDPEDPLSLKDTWMSVEIGVMPWEVHSYEIDLEF